MKKNKKLKAQIFLRYGTQEDFAQEIGVSGSLVSCVVNGRKQLNETKKEAWATALGMDKKELFQGA